MSQEVTDVVKEIFARQSVLDPSDISLDVPLAEIGIDSLGLAEAVFALEEHYNLHIPFNANESRAAAVNIQNVGTVIAAVEKLLAQQENAAP